MKMCGKKFGILSVFLLIAQGALASQLPENIGCEIDSGGKLVRMLSRILITKLNTNQPESNLPDTGLTDRNESKGKLTLIFSNECDNGYTLTFSLKELEKLASGKKDSIRARWRYGAGAVRARHAGALLSHACRGKTRSH